MSKKDLLHRLNAIGISTYVRRDVSRDASSPTAEAAASSVDDTPTAPPQTASMNVPNEARDTASPTAEAAASSVDGTPTAPPQTASMNVPNEVRDASSPTAEAAASSADDTPTAPPQRDAAQAWKALANEVAQCERCVLHKTRTQTVFGVGDGKAQWMFIGEGPGADEDAQGEPFVGRAGRLLTKMLSAIGLARDEVYIANIVKCRPPDNRNPRPEEVASCIGYLHRQIAMVRPEIIVCLGGVAAHELLKTEESVGRMRGREHTYSLADISHGASSDDASVAVIVTYHPAYLLRSPNQKKAAWDDLQLACRVVGRAIPERHSTTSG